jgi:hypothetical protein
MESNEGTFALKKNLIHAVSLLSDEKAGQLIKNIFEFANGEEPQIDEFLLKVIYEPIKHDIINQFKKDEEIKIKRKKAGVASGIARKKPKRTKTNKREQNEHMLTHVNMCSPKLDYQEIIDIFNTVCTDLPRAMLTDQRIKMIDHLLKTNSLEQIGQVFKNARDSDFINGKVNKWRANLNWLLTPNNFVKVLEGNYKNLEDPKNRIKSVSEQFQEAKDIVNKFY